MRPTSITAQRRLCPPVGSNGGGLSYVAGPGGAVYRTRTASLDEPELDRLADDLRQSLELLKQVLTRFVANDEPGCLPPLLIVLAAVSHSGGRATARGRHPVLIRRPDRRDVAKLGPGVDDDAAGARRLITTPGCPRRTTPPPAPAVAVARVRGRSARGRVLTQLESAPSRVWGRIRRPAAPGGSVGRTTHPLNQPTSA